MVSNVSNKIIRPFVIRLLDKKDTEISVDSNGERARSILDCLEVKPGTFWVFMEFCDSLIRPTSQWLA